MITARITVTRDDKEIEVTGQGEVEYFGSANPYERGERIGDWHADVELTSDEEDRMIEALECAMKS